jgi:hypothetical protein
MTSKELSNMIFDIKEKLTDKEFKDIMEKLSLTHKKEEVQQLYEFQYIEVERKVVSIDGIIKYYHLENTRKTCVFNKLKTYECDFDIDIVRPSFLWSKYRVYFSGVGVNTQLNIQDVNMSINDYTRFSGEYVNEYFVDSDSEESVGVNVKYDKIIPISFKKL